jgi:hypothetical protein
MQTAIILPAIALVLLTAIVWVRLYVERIRELRQRRIDPQSLATSLAGQTLQRVQASENFKNLFEVPVLFYSRLRHWRVAICRFALHPQLHSPHLQPRHAPVCRLCPEHGDLVRAVGSARSTSSVPVTRLLRFPSSVRRDPAIEVWMDEHSDELGTIAKRWFEVMRGCGDDVRELLHDGHPTETAYSDMKRLL